MTRSIIDGPQLYDRIASERRLKVAHASGTRLVLEADLVRGTPQRLVPFVLAHDGSSLELEYAYAGASAVQVRGPQEYLFLSDRRPDAAGPACGRSVWRHRDGDEPTVLISTVRDVVSFAHGGGAAVAAAWVHRRADSLSADTELRAADSRWGGTALLCRGDLWPRSEQQIRDEVLKLVHVGLDVPEPKSQLMALSFDPGTWLTGQLAITPDGSRCAAGLVRISRGGHRRYGLFVFTPDMFGRDGREVWADDDLSDPVASPDGCWFACTAERVAVPGLAPRQEPVLVAADELHVRKLGLPHEDWLQPRAWEDAAHLLCVGEVDGTRHLWCAAIDRQELRRVDCGGSVLAVTVQDGATLAVVSSVDSAPALVRFDGGVTGQAECRQVLPPAVVAGPAGRVERIAYTSSADGTTWRSLLCLPSLSDRPLPLLVWCHGGPMLSWTDWSWRWNPWPFVADGYAVLMIDPPLSIGYGQAAVERGWGRWTTEVARTAAEQVNSALLDPRLDAERVAVMGASFGGYLALALATILDEPRLVVSHCGWADFAAVARACDLHWHWLREYGPVKPASAYTRESLDLARVRLGTKVLLSHGAEDEHVPVGESRAIFRVLDSRGVDVELMLFPDEGHSIRRPPNAAAWFDWVRLRLRDALGVPAVQSIGAPQ